MIRKIDRADGVRFQVYGRRDGKQVYVTTCDSKRDAIAAEEEYRVTQRKIERGELAPRTDVKLTFETAVDKWIAYLKANPGVKGHRSWDEYEERIENHGKPRLGKMPLVDIGRDDIIALRDELSTTALSPSTVNTLVQTVSSAFRFFVDQRWLQHNPCHRVPLLEVKTKIFPWLQSGEAITRLLAELRTNICQVCAVLVGTGMRLDEALHLRWDDVDIEHRLITVHRGKKGTTKSGRARRVPIFDSVLVVLKAMKLARGTNVHLWPGAKPGKPLSQATVWYAFKDAVDRAGLPKQLRVHDLRHTFASLFLVDGGDIFKLSRILGHSSVAITEKTYAHLKPTAYAEDYGRVAFRMPSTGNVVALAAAR